MNKTLLVAMMLMGSVVGCTHQKPAESRAPATRESGPTTREASRGFEKFVIVYHRTGGIAGTDDRVVIWPDGLIQIRGKILPDGEGWMSKESMAKLDALAQNFGSYHDSYGDAGQVMDAYSIFVTIGGKSVTAWDLAPDLPPELRNLFTIIENIAAEVGTESKETP